MEGFPNCSYLPKGYLAITRAGRLRGLGSHLIHPENRTAQDTEADQLSPLKLVEERFAAQHRTQVDGRAGCHQRRPRQVCTFYRPLERFAESGTKILDPTPTPLPARHTPT